MENNKRGMKYGHNDENLEEDEMKMEKFYLLLRNFRDARDRRLRELKEFEKRGDRSNVKKMKPAAAGEASFEWKDFTTDIQFRKPPSEFPNPIQSDTVADPKSGKKKEQQQQQDHALDLKLAL